MTAKESIHKLHEKHYGPGSKAAKKQAKEKSAIEKVNDAIAKKGIGVRFATNKDGSRDMTISGPKVKELKQPIVVEGRGPEYDAAVATNKKLAAVPATVKGVTLAGLKLQAKVLGIKYFQILHRVDLEEILAGATPERTAELQAAAKKRWQDGWGKRKPVGVVVREAAPVAA